MRPLVDAWEIPWSTWRLSAAGWLESLNSQGKMRKKRVKAGIIALQTECVVRVGLGCPGGTKEGPDDGPHFLFNQHSVFWKGFTNLGEKEMWRSCSLIIYWVTTICWTFCHILCYTSLSKGHRQLQLLQQWHLGDCWLMIAVVCHLLSTRCCLWHSVCIKSIEFFNLSVAQ